MVVRALLAAMLGACGFVPSLAMPGDTGLPSIDGPHQIDAAPGAWFAGYAYRKAIHVTATLGAPLTDFPIGVLEPADADLVAHARADGRDLVVTSSDAVTQLDRELVTFGANGSFELWTRVPVLSPGPTTLYLYYGGPASSNTTAVWSARFAGVWHLGDGGMSEHDSTNHAHTVTASSVAANPIVIAGVAGNGRGYDGMNDGLGVTDPVDGSLDVGVSSFSLSLWLQIATPMAMYDTPLWKGGTSAGEHGYCVLTGTGSWLVKLHDGTHQSNATVGMQSALAGTWVHVVGVIDRSAMTSTAYRNGAQVDQVSISTIGNLDNTFDFYIGRPSNGAYRGNIDDVRLYREVLTHDWVTAEHANLTDPNFVKLAAEEAH